MWIDDSDYVSGAKLKVHICSGLESLPNTPHLFYLGHGKNGSNKLVVTVRYKCLV